MDRMVRLVIVAVSVCLLVPTPAMAWGFEAHRFITAEALRLLPAELRAFLDGRSAFVVEHSIDPDLWRNAGFEGEAPNHFLDLDYREYGPYPFTSLPRSYDAAIQKFGRETVERQGLLPWRTQEFFGKLQREFETLTRPSPPPYAVDNVAFYCAVLAHYVSDGHVPLHAVVNYDGQLTGQRGLHARWETALFERSRDRLTIAPPAPGSIGNPRDAMFEILLASNRLAPGVLDADKSASTGRESYGDEYFAEFGKRQFPVLERRVNESITAVVSIIVGAWDAAGRPVPRHLSTREPRKVPQP